MTEKRRVPQHLTSAVRSGKRHNARIREIIRKICEARETDLLLIYGRLNVIADETIQSDKEWGPDRDRDERGREGLERAVKNRTRRDANENDDQGFCDGRRV